jgi:hypothetical protein
MLYNLWVDPGLTQVYSWIFNSNLSIWRCGKFAVSCFDFLLIGLDFWFFFHAVLVGLVRSLQCLAWEGCTKYFFFIVALHFLVSGIIKPNPHWMRDITINQSCGYRMKTASTPPPPSQPCGGKILLRGIHVQRQWGSTVKTLHSFKIFTLHEANTCVALPNAVRRSAAHFPIVLSQQ